MCNIINEYYNIYGKYPGKGDNGDVLKKLNKNIEIKDSKYEQYMTYKDMIDYLCYIFPSKHLKRLSEISKQLYNVDILGYPEFTTIGKCYNYVCSPEFNETQFNFICECIKYTYNNYDHELP